MTEEREIEGLLVSVSSVYSCSHIFSTSYKVNNYYVSLLTKKCINGYPVQLQIIINFPQNKAKNIETTILHG